MSGGALVGWTFLFATSGNLSFMIRVGIGGWSRRIPRSGHGTLASGHSRRQTTNTIV